MRGASDLLSLSKPVSKTRGAPLPSRRLAVALAASLALLPLQVVLAIGPDNQILNPTFDSVVRILYDKPGFEDAGDGYMNGTGTIIGNHDVDGVGYLCVLTADHVISTNGTKAGATVASAGIAFGNSVKTSGNSAYLKGSVLGRYGDNGTSDLAVLGVPYGLFDPSYDALVRNLVSASAFFFFSDIGYGNEGKLVTGGYQAQNKYGTERFLNDKIGVFQANYTRDGYKFEGAEWFITNPTNSGSIAGTGTPFDADSGSPYFSSATNHDENTDLYYATDNQFAVHSGVQFFTNAPPGFRPFGTELIGDALTTADITWIHGLCDAVPEPGALLVVTPVVMVLLLRRRTAAGPRRDRCRN